MASQKETRCLHAEYVDSNRYIGLHLVSYWHAAPLLLLAKNSVQQLIFLNPPLTFNFSLFWSKRVQKFLYFVNREILLCHHGQKSCRGIAGIEGDVLMITSDNNASKNNCPMNYRWVIWVICVIWVIKSHTESWCVIWLIRVILSSLFSMLPCPMVLCGEVETAFIDQRAVAAGKN